MLCHLSPHYLLTLVHSFHLGFKDGRELDTIDEVTKYSPKGILMNSIYEKEIDKEKHI